MESFADIWNTVLAEMEKDISHVQINLWYSELKLVCLDREKAVLANHSEFKRDILNSKYKPTVQSYFEKVLGFPVTVYFIDDSDTSLESILNPDGQNHTSSSGEKIPEEPKIPLAAGFAVATGRIPDIPAGQVTVEHYYKNGVPTPLSGAGEKFSNDSFSQYTFDNFIVGSSNKFAHAACLAVASNASSAYNPLFIYGDSGLGKTHLLYAITNEIIHRNPQAKIIYVKGDDFTNQLIESISKNSTELFRDKYRRADVLLLDDIQFIAGRKGTQEEFFHTFNALYEDHKRIIMTSDVPPREIRQLEDRLRTRFEWGLLADIQAPDYELRIAIMKSKAELLGISLPPEVLDWLATNLRSNVRQLEGAVKKLGAQSFLTGVPITLDLAISCVADMVTGSEPVSVTVDRIFEKTSKKYGIPVDVIKGRKRNKEISLARHVSIYLIRKLTDMSTPAIGKIMGRDHATVLSSLDAVEKMIRDNTLFDNEINDLIKDIKTSND